MLVRWEWLGSVTVGFVEGGMPISGYCFNSSRPALRPLLAAAKAFSHSFSSERSFCEYSVGLTTSPSIVKDIVVVAQLALSCAGLGGIEKEVLASKGEVPRVCDVTCQALDYNMRVPGR